MKPFEEASFAITNNLGPLPIVHEPAKVGNVQDTVAKLLKKPRDELR